MKYLLTIVILFNAGQLFAMTPFDFKTDLLTDKPNQYLVCPKNYCNAKPNEVSPIFSVSEDTLNHLWQKIPLKEPRTKLIQVHDNYFFYEQRSKVFKFPDYITVKIIPIDEQHATIAIYSQAKYGYYDFGVNKKRVERWLKKIKIFIK